MGSRLIDLSGLYKAAKPSARHIHRELPYRYYDHETTLFHNVRSIGFGRKLSVLGSASMELIKALNALVCGLPEGKKWDYQLVMVGDNQVGHLLEKNQEALSARGGVMATCAENESIYAKYSAKNGFSSNYINHHYNLKNYSAYFFISTKASEEHLLDVKSTVEAELTQAGIAHQPMAAEYLIAHVSGHLNFDAEVDRPVVPDYNEYEHLNQQMVVPDSEFRMHKDYIDTRFTRYNSDTEARTRIVSLGLKRLPSAMRLGNIANVLASLLKPVQSIRCPHRISVNFRIHETAKEINTNERKIASLAKMVESPMKILVPFAVDELEERKDLQRGMDNQDFKLAGMAMSITLYTDKDHYKEDQAKAISTFRSANRQGGLDIVPSRMLQAQSVLSCLPFQMTEGYWEDCRAAGRVRTIKTSNLVNFFPIIAEYKRLSPGLLLPTMRHQINFFDAFECGSDNYNIAVSGGSGAGKSYHMQCQVKAIYARGGKVWILDKGCSYKKLTKQFGGTYMNHQQIFLNPFTHLAAVRDHRGEVVCDVDGKPVNPLKEVLGDITALIAVMAAPNSEMTDYELSAIGDAIIVAFDANEQATMIDHVQTALMELAIQRDNDRRLKDLAYQLNQYCSDGIYGEIFNKPSQLDPTVDITTLELDGFSDNVLRPVVFALMAAINQQMYLSGSRSTPKMCIIEEAWSLMAGSNKQSRQFIEQGYRTVRKFGGSFCCVTQGIDDYFKSDEAKVAFNNSDIHITLRQGEGFGRFLRENPDHFTPFETEMIKSFPRASDAGYSCCMISAGGAVTFHRLFSDAWTRSLLSTASHEYEYCERLINNGFSIEEAVQKTALNFYPDEIEKFEKIKAEVQEEQKKQQEAHYGA